MNKLKKTKSHQTKITEAEREIFRASLDDIQPLNNDKLHFSHKTTQALTTHSQRTNPTETFFHEDFASSCEAEELLFFAKPGLQHKILTKLRRGQIKIEARLDLHKLTANEALEQSEQFIHNAQARGYRWVLLIHGKGHYSKDGKPVLKSLMNHWLKQQEAVLAFTSSQPKDGGTGALYILLKRVN